MTTNRDDNLPVPTTADLDVDAIWRRTQEMNDNRVEEFPSFGTSTGLFTKTLVGVPFIIVSEPVFRTQTGGKFGPQEVAQVYIRLFDDSWHLREAQLATLTGAYLLPRLRNATRNELVGSYVWTVWPNYHFQTVGGNAPLMLKRYAAGDMPPDDTTASVWDGGDKPDSQPPSLPFPPATTGVDHVVATHIQEIEQTGPVPPPWETQATGPSGHTRRGQK